MDGVETVDPTFAQWGLDLTAPAAPPRRRSARMRRPSAGVCIAVVAALCAFAAALIVHVADGGSPAAGATRAGIAHAINLGAADLPGFSASSVSGVSASGDPATQFKACFGSLPGAGGAGADGPSFGSPDLQRSDGVRMLQFSSSVAFPAAPAFAAEARLAADARFPQCFAQALGAIDYNAHGTQITIGNSAGAALPFPAGVVAARERLAGIRITFDLTAGAIRVPTYMDLYAMRVGRDEVDMFALSSGGPPPADAEARLLAILDERAQAQPH